MNPINFITTLSVKEQRSLRTWWKFSVCVLFFIALSIIALQSIQLYTLYTTATEHSRLQTRALRVQTELEPYTHLKKEETTLRAQRTKIDSIAHTIEHMSSLLAALYATDQAVRIHSCKLNKSRFDLVIHAPNTESALNEVKRLRAIKRLETVKLVSLQQAQQQTNMIATIQGAIRKA